MNNTKEIKVTKTNVVEIIKKYLNDCKVSPIEVDDAKYHHTISYDKVSSAIENGILSLEEQYRLYGKFLTSEQKKKFSREGGHINGIDEISLSSMDIDFDKLYHDEIVYDPFSSYSVDIVISSFIKTYRITEHYANEYLTENKISNEHFKAIDIRIIKHLINNPTDKQICEAINYYNWLRVIAYVMLKERLDIPLREMSNENITLDKIKVLGLPKISMKK